MWKGIGAWVLGSTWSCHSSIVLPVSIFLGPHVLKPFQQGFCSTQQEEYLIIIASVNKTPRKVPLCI